MRVHAGRSHRTVFARQQDLVLAQVPITVISYLAGDVGQLKLQAASDAMGRNDTAGIAAGLMLH